MPAGLKRQLSGGRADEYERYHAVRQLQRRNAPPWNAEGALAALDVAPLVFVWPTRPPGVARMCMWGGGCVANTYNPQRRVWS